jgi:hypothetical protein
MASPGCIHTLTAISFAIVPDGVNSAASCPSSSATRSCRRFTVGSSPYTSSPSSAFAIARRISGVGRVTVSERRSTRIRKEGNSHKLPRLLLLPSPPVSPSSASRERGNARIPLSHPVGEGLGVRAKKHKHLICVYGAYTKTAVYVYGHRIPIRKPSDTYTEPSYTYTKLPNTYTKPSYTYTKTAVYIYRAVVYLYEIVGYIYESRRIPIRKLLDTYTEPSDTYTKPSDTYTKPSDTYTKPPDTYTEPS